MVSWIVMALVSVAVGIFFFTVSEFNATLNLFIFGFAVFGFLTTIRYIANGIIKHANNKRKEMPK